MGRSFDAAPRAPLGRTRGPPRFMRRARLRAAVSEAWAYVGSAILAVATVPQAVRLFRDGHADSFGWTFVALNTVGIALLLARAVAIREPAFVLVNAMGVAFWGYATFLKGRSAVRARRTRTLVPQAPPAVERELRAR